MFAEDLNEKAVFEGVKKGNEEKNKMLDFWEKSIPRSRGLPSMSADSKRGSRGREDSRRWGQVVGSLGWKGEAGILKAFSSLEERKTQASSEQLFRLMSPSVATALRIDSGGT